MGFTEWNERQNERIAGHPIRWWLIAAAIIGGWIAFLHALTPDRPVVWPIVALYVLGVPTTSVAAVLLRRRRQQRGRSGAR